MSSIDIEVTEEWQALSILSGFPVGTALSLNNKGNDWLLLADSGQPQAESTDGYPVSPFNQTEASYVIVTEGTPEVWIKSKRWICKVFVQEL